MEKLMTVIRGETRLFAVHTSGEHGEWFLSKDIRYMTHDIMNAKLYTAKQKKQAKADIKTFAKDNDCGQIYDERDFGIVPVRTVLEYVASEA